ncbi:unnamed protein product [Clonostachys chloroleuca]|uniref:Biotin-protein ligase N-terminal domain-containing protein n=1 Tax=Clonostachys chloroleuca TaxID=1926264 RepID=A0AA35PSV6_9HYPO|nr:unnamed protein product [Clonostachys chloroleuca]
MRFLAAMGLLPTLSALVEAVPHSNLAQPLAVVYRGNQAPRECSDSVGKLLTNSEYNFKVTYAGPTEEVDLSPELLSQASIYAYPGGPDVERSWKELKEHGDTIRNFVLAGGRYMGFCLGAYLAGQSALNLLPEGIDVGSEIQRDNSQVKGPEDTTIQVDWTFNASTGNSRLDQGRWAYFQEGAVVLGFKGDDPRVVGRYSRNKDVAASVTPYGKGFVGLVGPHPEADAKWYSDAEITNPDGIQTDIGYDFIKSTMQGISVPSSKTDN